MTTTVSYSKTKKNPHTHSFNNKSKEWDEKNYESTHDEKLSID